MPPLWSVYEIQRFSLTAPFDARKCSSLGSTALRMTATTKDSAMQLLAKIDWNRAGNWAKMPCTCVKPMPIVRLSAAMAILRWVKPRFGDHLEAGEHNRAEHHDGAAAEHRLRQ